MQTFPDLELDSFPATDLDPEKAPDAPAVLLNKEFGDIASKLYMYKITWSGKNGKHFRRSVHTLEQDLLVSQRQLEAVSGDSAGARR